MKKGSFDLTGKVIDCRELPAMGEAGKEIFRALKVACNGYEHPEYAQFRDIKPWGYLSLSRNSDYSLVNDGTRATRIQLTDVLGQARIDAAKDGATLVFEGDVIPKHSSGMFYGDGTKTQGRDTREYTLGPKHIIIAHKALEEKQPSIESRILSEKMGFKELSPVCSPKDWADREAETYDELRDAHLELVRENMLLVKENEALAQRIKDLHRAINDAKAALDE